MTTPQPSRLSVPLPCLTFSMHCWVSEKEYGKEWLAKMRAGQDLGADDEETRIRVAAQRLLGVLTKSFLELTEEIAGDIDQDIRP
jgi:hypothetical protein